MNELDRLEILVDPEAYPILENPIRRDWAVTVFLSSSAYSSLCIFGGVVDETN